MVILSFCHNHLSLILITLHSEQKLSEVRSYTDKGYPVVADLLLGMPPPLSGSVMVSRFSAYDMSQSPVPLGILVVHTSEQPTSVIRTCRRKKKHNPPFEQVDDVLKSANGIDMIDLTG